MRIFAGLLLAASVTLFFITIFVAASGSLTSAFFAGAAANFSFGLGLVLYLTVKVREAIEDNTDRLIAAIGAAGPKPSSAP